MREGGRGCARECARGCARGCARERRFLHVQDASKANVNAPNCTNTNASVQCWSRRERERERKRESARARERERDRERVAGYGPWERWSGKGEYFLEVDVVSVPVTGGFGHVTA